MNTKMVTLLMVTIFSVTFAGCASFLGEPGSPSDGFYGASAQKASSPLEFRELDDWLTRNMLSVTAGKNGMNDYNRAFSQGAVIVYGEANSSDSFSNPAQRRLTTQRAAEVVAQRNLADFFAGHERFGEIRFRTYSVRLEAFLKGASVVASDYDAASGKAAVLLKLDLRGAGGFAP